MLKIDLTILKNKNLEVIQNTLRLHTSRVYLVGGCVRDIFLGKNSVDFDIEVYDINPHKFDKLMQSIGADGVGKSYFIYKFKNYDIGLARTESKTGDKHNDFMVSVANDEKIASKRRDFSINAIMINIFTGEVLDLWGGIDSIKNKTIKHINSDKFIEDSLRVLRAIQFSSRFNFQIADETLNLMKMLSLDNLSKDRISSELLKFFKSEFLEVGVEYIYKLNLFEKLFNIQVSKDELINFKTLVKNSRKFIKDEHLFFYLLCGYFSVDCEKIATNLKLPKSYINLKKERFFKDEILDSDMIKIAIAKPLNLWLGSYNQQRITRAKELGIYNNKFKLNFNPQELLRLGFKGENLKNEIKRLTNMQIENFLKSKSGQ